MKRIVALSVMLILFLLQTPVHAFTIQDGSSTGDRVSIMGNIDVKERTLGDVVSIAGNADVYNDVNGDVVVIMGNAKIDSRISGDVVSIMGTVTLTDRAEIMGDLVSIGSIDKAPGAVIHGQDTIINFGGRTNIGNFNLEFLTVVKTIALVVSLLLIFILGFPVLAVAGRRFQNMEASIEEGIGKKLAVGFLTLVGSFIIMIIFSWTVVIPLAYLILILIAKVAASVYLGKALINLFNSRLNIYLEFTTGILIIALVKIIFVILLPEALIIQGVLLNSLTDLFINSIGIGILVVSKFGKSEF